MWSIEEIVGAVENRFTIRPGASVLLSVPSLTARLIIASEIANIYWTVGQYDLVTVADFPDDETGTEFLLALGSQGNVRTTTLRAYNASEVAGVIGKLT